MPYSLRARLLGRRGERKRPAPSWDVYSLHNVTLISHKHSPADPLSPAREPSPANRPAGGQLEPVSNVLEENPLARQQLFRLQRAQGWGIRVQSIERAEQSLPRVTEQESLQS